MSEAAKLGLISAEEIADLRKAAQGGDSSDFGEATSARILSLLNEVGRARALLKRIEWKAGDEQGHYCVECEYNQHRPSCELAALIAPSAECKFCGTDAEVKEASAPMALLIRAGEKFLTAHETPDGRPCVNGSGLLLADNSR